MKAWDIDEIRRAVKGKWLMRGPGEGAGGRRFNGRISTDSRKASAGDLFFAIKGERFDAHEFVTDVVERDVACIIVHKDPATKILNRAKERDVAIVRVDDTISALNRLAAAYRSGEISDGMRAKVIAVGGSNGKTTTKRIIHALLSEKYGANAGLASPKSFNNNIGVPLTLLEVAPSHEYVVLEIGTNAPGEIAALGEVCRPDIAVITSVGLEHLEKLCDLEGVAREEASIAPFVAEGGTLILPADAPELMAAIQPHQLQRILIGRRGDSADFVLGDVAESLAGTIFSINGRGQFHLPLLGEHNAINALTAIAVARRMGVSEEQIAAGLGKVAAAEGRFESLSLGPCRVINDAYNANPTSMEAALRTFARLSTGAGRRVVILGDMLELGKSSKALHQSVGGLVAELGFDLFIAIGPAMRHAANAAKARGMRAVVAFSRTLAARRGLARWIKPGDNVLLKGSHGMALESLLSIFRDSPIHAPVSRPVKTARRPGVRRAVKKRRRRQTANA